MEFGHLFCTLLWMKNSGSLNQVPGRSRENHHHPPLWALGVCLKDIITCNLHRNPLSGGRGFLLILERKKLRLRKAAFPRSHKLRVAELALDSQVLTGLPQFCFLPNVMDSLRVLSIRTAPRLSALHLGRLWMASPSPRHRSLQC